MRTGYEGIIHDLVMLNAVAPATQALRAAVTG